MNYFAHGVRFLDRPWFAAGTAVPDWLSVVNRRIRAKSRMAVPLADGSGSPMAELAAGILQHISDDDWFHRSQAFQTVSSTLSQAFRTVMPDPYDHRPPFLGHIVTEILMDGILISYAPARLEAYYRMFAQIDPDEVERHISQIVGRPVENLGWFVRAFVQERFLADYGEPSRLLHRLNQVMRRVKLEPLPIETQGVLEHAWTVVEPQISHLLCGFAPEHRHLLFENEPRNAQP